MWYKIFTTKYKIWPNFLTPFPFPFPIIPGNYNVSFPFPKVGNRICHSRSRSQKLGMEFVIPVPIPKSWECYFSFPFPFPKFGNGLSNSCSRSQSQKTIPAHPWFIHQQNGSTAQNVDSEGMPISTNRVIKLDRNNKWYDNTAPCTSTNVLINKMGQPSRL